MPEGWRICPVLVVTDVASSLAYYRDRLGFDVIGSFGEPLEMAFVGRSGIQSVAWDAHVWLDDVDAYAGEIARRGAKVTGPRDTFYGRRELEVTDPDGYVLCFSAPLRAAAGPG